jgi:hypothetical protein
MKRLFKNNIPVRQIMELHNNPDDLIELCTDIYNTIKEYNISAPLYMGKARYFLQDEPV